MGSRPWNRTPGGQDAVPRPSCCAFPCCCSSPASRWFERYPVPQLPILWSSCPSGLPRPSCEQSPRCPHPQHHPRADSVLAASPGCTEPCCLPCHNCQRRECCSRLQHGARPDCCPREPSADRPAAAAAAADRCRQALRPSLNLCPVDDSVWTQTINMTVQS